MKYDYIKNFEKLGFGLFVHFGLYSLLGAGEWCLDLNPEVTPESYEKLTQKFVVKKTWAKELVATAKAAGCKYITITTRHHDGFSLYDTCGLNDYDAPHSACGRDLIREFVDACNAGGIVPFFYHTLLDWRDERYQKDFPAYLDYLIKSVEILCKNYGKIGGLWFDGMWNKPNEDWREDDLYATIRKYQPEAMIINNTGLNALGQVGHEELDSVTFERGAPCFVDRSKKPIAGEMCQVLNDHWGYAKNDCNYKSLKELIENLVDCRKYGCNFLLNTGLRGNGGVNAMDGQILREIGKWVKVNAEFVYGANPCDKKAEGAEMTRGEDCYYAIIKDVPKAGDPNVQRAGASWQVRVDDEIEKAIWLDTGKEIPVENGGIAVEPFLYGTSRCIRIAKVKLKK